MLSIHKSCVSSSCLSTPVRHRGRQHPGAASTRVLALRRRAHRRPPVFASSPPRLRIIFRRWSSMPGWEGSSLPRSRRASHSVLFRVHLRKVYGRSVCLVDVCSAVRITTFGSRKYIWKRGIDLNIQLGNVQHNRVKKPHFFVFPKKKM